MMQIQKSWSVVIICIPSHGTHLSRVEGCRQIYPRHVRCGISSSSGWGWKSDSCDWWKATGAEKVAGVSWPGCASCLGDNVWLCLPDLTNNVQPYCKQGFKIITVWTTVSDDGFRPNDDKSRSQVMLKRSYCYAAALDNGAVHPGGLVSLLGPKVTLQPLPLLCKNDSEGFPHPHWYHAFENLKKKKKKRPLYKVCVIKIVFFKSDNPARKPA